MVKNPDLAWIKLLKLSSKFKKGKRKRNIGFSHET